MSGLRGPWAFPAHRSRGHSQNPVRGRSLAGVLSPPDSEAPASRSAAPPRPDPAYPAPARTRGDPVGCHPGSPSCWPYPSCLLQWLALKFNQGERRTDDTWDTLGWWVPGAQESGSPHSCPKKHQAAVTTNCLPSDWPGEKCCPCKQTELWSVAGRRKPKAGCWNHRSPRSLAALVEGERRKRGLPPQFHPPKKDPRLALDLVLLEVPETSTTSHSVLWYMLRLSLLRFQFG